MEVIYELNCDDLFALKKYERTLYAPDNSVKWIAFVSFFLFSLFEFYTLSYYLSYWWMYVFISNGIFISCFYILRLLWQTFQDKKSASRNSRLFKNSTVKAELNNKELRFISEDSEARYSWKSIKRIEKRRNHIFIQAFPDSFYLIPRRCFENDVHEAAFLQTAIDYTRGSENLDENIKTSSFGKEESYSSLTSTQHQSPVELLFRDDTE